MPIQRALLWLRRDLRLDDHQALQRLLEDGYEPIPVYIHSPHEEAPWTPGAASHWWLHHSLQALSLELSRRGSGLIVRRGDSGEELHRLIAQTGASAVYWHRLYEPALIARDTQIKAQLRAQGLVAHSCSGHLLAEPDRLLNKAGSAYRVFTPYWRALRVTMELLGPPWEAPDRLPPVPAGLAGMAIAELALLPSIAWDGGLRTHWSPGEQGAHTALASFTDTALADYAQARDRPDLRGTSALSAHLHFGEISVRRIAAQLLGNAHAEAYLRELGWRDFSHYLLRHFPQTSDVALNPRFANFDWAEPCESALQRWQRGMTGIPIVDAGMRQLWHCGWMHNRVRMIVASLLTKNLRYHWLHGARWFWDTLVDADLASNTQGWQWTAGTGADAAPYFRIFNPVTQGQRFDPNGDYVRRWVPELGRLGAAAIQQPWTIGGVAGYPAPLVDLKQSREQALIAFKALKQD